MNLTLKIWRQPTAAAPGEFVEYAATDIPAEASFPEMLDIVNDGLSRRGEEPVAFDHDCREGICGMCSLVIDGVPHGPGHVTTCQVYMRKFKDGATVWIEPFRARAFPVLKDLMVDRSAFDRIQRAGGFITARVGSAPDGNALPVPKPAAEAAMDAAACLGCGACVAACPNAAAMLFVGAKIAHLGLLPQGQPERTRRALGMVAQMDAEGFGNCSNYFECEAVCPAEIKRGVMAMLNREFAVAAARETCGIEG